MKDCLVIVDMVNGFVNFGALADKKINEITPEIVNLVKWAIREDIPIIAFKDTHEKNDIEFNTFPPHCIKGSLECELIPELKKYEEYFYVIEKNTTNGFNTDEFKRIANKFNFENMIITGCCTDICVKSFALSYKKFLNATNKKTNLFVPSYAVATFDSPTHNAKKANKQALEEMRAAGIQIVDADQAQKEL